MLLSPKSNHYSVARIISIYLYMLKKNKNWSMYSQIENVTNELGQQIANDILRFITSGFGCCQFLGVGSAVVNSLFIVPPSVEGFVC